MSGTARVVRFCGSCRRDVNGNGRELLLDGGTKCHGCGWVHPDAPSERLADGYAVLHELLDETTLALAWSSLPQEDRFELVERLDMVVKEIVTREKRESLLRIAADL